MIETTADRKEYDFHRVLEYYPECSFDSFTIKEYSILFEHGPEISYLDFHQYIQCKMIRYERELMHAQIIRDADKLIDDGSVIWPEMLMIIVGIKNTITLIVTEKSVENRKQYKKEMKY